MAKKTETDYWQERMVHLRGVPQIPDALAEQFQRRQSVYVEPEPEGELLEECEASIEAACREIRRRNDRLETLPRED